MIKFLYFLAMLIVCLLAYYFFILPKTGKGNDPFTKYELVKDWLQLPAGFVLGNPTGIGIDSNQNIFVFHRAYRKWPANNVMPDSNISSNTILMLDRETGKIINSWGADLFIMPHGLTVDKWDNIWVTDVALHQVFKFSHDGVLLMKLGQPKVPGTDSSHFNLPTDVAVTDDGSFYVSDGYGNSRVIKFSAAGKYLFEWGKKGNEEGGFNIPHAISLDEKGNVYVADRENKRGQVFDSAGIFLKQYSHNSYGSICSVTFDKAHQQLIAVDDDLFFKLKHRGSDVIIFDTAGKVQTRFGRSGFYTGATCWYHDAAVDDEGNIYTGDILGNSIQKFRKVTSPK
jgi:peptidylamidoglycolate lyase